MDSTPPVEAQGTESNGTSKGSSPLRRLVQLGSNPNGRGAELGEYIFALNPYYAKRPPKEEWEKAYPSAIVQMTQEDYDACKKGALYFLDTTGLEQHEHPGTWDFKYAEHYVDRALRVPYMYYKESDLSDDSGEPDAILVFVLVRDYFLIGFEGGAVYKRAKD